MKLLLDGDTLTLDNTAMEKVDRCYKAADFYLRQRREPAASNGALNMGSAIHAALEARYGGASLDVQLQTLTDWFAQHPQPIGEWRTQVLAADVIRRYHKTYPTEVWRPLTVEARFALPFMTHPGGGELPQPTKVLYAGRIDLIGDSGNLFILDHKTASRDDQASYLGYNLSAQFMGYCWAASQLLDRRINTAMLNSILIRQPGPTNQKRGTDIEFLRHTYVYHPAQIDAWAQDCRQAISDWLDAWARGYFRRSRSQCVGRYGTCPYFDVCVQAKSEHQARLLASDVYQDVTWSPLAK